MPIIYPLINGNRYDFSSVKLKVTGLPYSGVKSITYKHGVEPGKLRGTRAQVMGATRGEYNAEGSIEIYKQEFNELITALSLGGRGYFEQFFEATVSYAEGPESPVITDLLRGVRLISAENGHAEGADGLFVRCDLLIMYILENGKAPLSPLQMLT